MKKLNVLLLLMSFTVSAQWTKEFFDDEFGDPTDSSYESMIANGTFSNSATQNSKATYDFAKTNKAVVIRIYEYGNKLATGIEDTFEIVKIKQPTGEVFEIKKVLFLENGSLAFTHINANYNRIIHALSESGDYIMIFNKSGDYGKSSYRIKFTIE